MEKNMRKYLNFLTKTGDLDVVFISKYEFLLPKSNIFAHIIGKSVILEPINVDNVAIGRFRNQVLNHVLQRQ